MAQNEIRSQSRRHPRFFLCGICNIVSIAENLPNEGNGTKNKVPTEKEKRFVSVRDAQHEEDRDTTESRWNLSSKDDESAELQKRIQNQSLPQRTSSRNEEKRFGKATGKMCWTASREDIEHVDCDNEAGSNVEEDSVDSGFDPMSSRTTQYILEKGDLTCIETPCKDKMTNDKDQWENEKDRRWHQGNSALKDPTFVSRGHIFESFDSKESQTLENEPSSSEPVAKDITSCDKEVSNVPEIKLNGAELKHAWLEEKPTLPGSRWKRVVALKTNASRRKRRQRDSVTINEEYDLMIANLKQYGVL